MLRQGSRAPPQVQTTRVRACARARSASLCASAQRESVTKRAARVPANLNNCKKLKAAVKLFTPWRVLKFSILLTYVGWSTLYLLLTRIVTRIL